ncbi:MAG: N-acetylmuramidase domain-containing protein [Henriciella sp.]|nr:N-acetylmuramidase domain-containing protein [Henriciella sp.]
MAPPRISGRELLSALRSGGAVSRARIFHDTPWPEPAARVPFEQHLRAAQVLDLDPLAVRAISIVETRDRPFIEGVPIVRFEARWWTEYRRATKAAKQFDRFKNRLDLLKRWDGFQSMRQLQAGPAIKAHSFGAFQIMGFNYDRCGFDSPEAFYKAMMTVDGQVNAVIRFIQSSPRLHEALRQKDGHGVGRHYNGPAYRKNHYDTKWLAALEVPLA